MFDKLADVRNVGNLRCTGPLCLENDSPSNAADVFDTLISTVIGVMTMIAALWFIFQVIIGGYGWISAGGDKAAVEKARNKIYNGLMGLTVVIIAIFILDIVGELFGLEYITKPANFIRSISP